MFGFWLHLAVTQLNHKIFLTEMDITSEIEIEAKRALEEEDNPEPLTRASAPVSTYQMRPNLNDRFKAQTVKEMIHSVLNDELGGKIYNAEEAEVWTKTITSAVRNKIKASDNEDVDFSDDYDSESEELTEGVSNNNIDRSSESDSSFDSSDSDNQTNVNTDLGFQRYKFMVQVILGEQHGAGVKTGARCLWDADTDNYASAVFLNIYITEQGFSTWGALKRILGKA
ncbi:unnamed protein product [Timema podura]|uniref:Uncharacterized protein n=1 Tax=Timema podura TaxID=61482 RepID=A0ABN7NK56_TIMPD|nr:unnamed protein product [Timema podura]